jgi:hypothetical protein
LKAGASAVQALPRRSAPAGVLAGVRSRLAEAAAAPASEHPVAPRYWRSASLSAAAFLMLGVIIWALYSPHMPPPEGRVAMPSRPSAAPPAEAKREAAESPAPAGPAEFRADKGPGGYKAAEARDFKEEESLQRPAPATPAPVARPPAPPPAATAPAEAGAAAAPRSSESAVRESQKEKRAGKLAGAEPPRVAAAPRAPAQTGEQPFGANIGRAEEKPVTAVTGRAKVAKAPSAAPLLPKGEANEQAQTLAPNQPAEPPAPGKPPADERGALKLKQDAATAAPAKKEAPDVDEADRGVIATVKPAPAAKSGFPRKEEPAAPEQVKQKDENLEEVAKETVRQLAESEGANAKLGARAEKKSLEGAEVAQERKALDAKKSGAPPATQTWQVRAADLARVARQLEALAGQSDGYALWGGGPGAGPAGGAQEGRAPAAPAAQTAQTAQTEAAAADQPTAGVGGGAQSETARPAAAPARARGSATQRVVLRVPAARQAEVLAALVQYRQQFEAGRGGKDQRAGELALVEQAPMDKEAEGQAEARRMSKPPAAEAPGQARAEDGRPQGKAGQDLAEIAIEIEVVP